MPIYEYACHGCGRQFEKLVRSDTVLACPDCGGDDLQKLLSAFAVRTRGRALPQAPAGAPCGGCSHPDGPGACKYDS